MTNLESTPARRVPASWYTRVRLVLLTFAGGYAVLIPFVQESTVFNKIMGLLLGVVVVLGDVLLWLGDTRPGFWETQGARVLRRAIYSVTGAVVVLFAVHFVF